MLCLAFKPRCIETHPQLVLDGGLFKMNGKRYNYKKRIGFHFSGVLLRPSICQFASWQPAAGRPPPYARLQAGRRVGRVYGFKSKVVLAVIWTAK